VSIEDYSHTAAAEIERYVQSRIASEQKTVPMAMLRAIDYASIPNDPLSNDELSKIAARYGYEVTE
jgi:hypothetical protein